MGCSSFCPPRSTLRYFIRVARPFALALLTVSASAAQAQTAPADSVGMAIFSLPLRPAPDVSPTLEPFASVEPDRPTLALILSGGASRGIAHIGVLRALDEAHIPIDAIIGTSMGAIIGGLYASGYTPSQLIAMADTLDWTGLTSLNDSPDRGQLSPESRSLDDRSFLTLRLDGLRPTLPSALSNGQRLLSFLNDLTLQAPYHAEQRFSQLKIPLYVVTTDLPTGRQIVLRDGELAEAMRASMTVPLLFEPVRRDSLRLVDGGLVANIPVDVADSLVGADLTVASDVTANLRPAATVTGALEAADQMLGILMQLSNRTQLARATVAIRPPLGDRTPNDFSDVPGMIRAGYETTLPQLDSIRARLLAAQPHRVVQPTQIELTGVDSAEIETLRALVNAADGRVDDGLRALYATDRVARAEARLDGTTLTYTVTLHPTMRGWRADGTTLIGPAELDSLFQPLVGRPTSPKAVRSALEQVLSHYRSQGWSLARVRSVALVGDTLSVLLDEGRISAIRVEGVSPAGAQLVRREVPLSPGDPFTIDRFRRAQAQLSGTLLFSQVSIGVRYEAGQPVLAVRVRETLPRLLRLGARVDNARNAQGMIDLRHENLFDLGWQAGLTVMGGAQNLNADLELRAVRLWSTYLTGRVAVFHHQSDYFTWREEPVSSDRTRWRSGPPVREQHSGATVSLGEQVARLGVVSLGLTSERVEFNPIGADGDASIWQTGLAVRSLLDSRNTVPFPRDGVMAEATFSTWPSWLNRRDGSFSRLEVLFESYNAWGSRLTFRPRYRIGFGDETLPEAYQFRLGGPLGTPSAFVGVPDGALLGRQLLLGSFELRYRVPVAIVGEAYLIGLADLGGTWSSSLAVGWSGVRQGLGVAVGVPTPVGAARVAYGRAIQFNGPPFRWGPNSFTFAVGYDL